MSKCTDAVTCGFMAAVLVTGLSSTPVLADEYSEYSRTIDWSGLFLGVQAGAADGSSLQDIVSPSVDVSIDVDGGFLGGTVEYLWQNGSFVFGPQAEIVRSSVDGSFSRSPTNHFSSETEWFGSVGGKAGLAFDNLLLFGTAGYAFGEIVAGQSNSTIVAISRLDTEFNSGYALGGGVELMLQDGWVAGIEYRHYEFSGSGYFASPPFQPRSQDTDFRTISFHLKRKLY